MREIFYFDEEGVAGLAAQLKGGALESYSREVEHEAKIDGAIKPKMSFGGVLKALGLMSLDVEAELSTSRERRESRTENFKATPVDQYNAIVAALTGDDTLYRDFDSARTAAVAAGDSVFCDVGGLFTPEFDENEYKDWRDQANDNKFLVLMSADGAVELGMSFRKIISLGEKVESVTTLSHLAIQMRQQGGLKLQVFGRFNGANYLKPFVVFHN